MKSLTRYGLIAAALVTGAGVRAETPAPLPPAPDATCATASATIAFDFEGASQSRCVIEGEREFSILVSPEHAPPINPSPWYAFRYASGPGTDLTVHVRYLEGRHRYPPKWRGQGDAGSLAAAVAEDGKSVTITLPAGSGIVSSQEVFDGARHAHLLDELAAKEGVVRATLGLSHDGRPVEALRIGRPDAPRLVILLGRAHPPEVSGAIAMEAFLRRIAAGAGGLKDTQVIAIPLLNPDGVARGHWRANRGGLDLNRDWGEYTQPETRAVGDWLAGLPPTVRPVAMVDFHSTQRNLFYVQGEDETDEQQESFLAQWLGGQEQAIEGYPFTIERRNANPGSGTSKNWFNVTYGIPAYTYEVGDETDRDAIVRAASMLAEKFLVAIAEPDRVPSSSE